MAKQFTLSKSERLKSRKQIEQLFDKGKSFSIYPYKVIYQLKDASDETNELGFGVTAGSRNFKKAKDRNRIKRLTREAYRLNKLPLKEKLSINKKQLQVFFIYTGKELPEFNLVKEKMIAAINRLIKLADESSVAHT